MEPENLAEASFGALCWGIGKPLSQKRRKPGWRSKVRKREKAGMIAAVCNLTISHGEWVPGLLRERLLPFLEGIWKSLCVLSRDKGPAGER